MGSCSSGGTSCCLLSHPIDNSNDFDDEPIAAYFNPKDHINDFDWDKDIIIDVKPQKKGIFIKQATSDPDIPLPVAISIKVKDRNHHYHDSLPIDVVCIIDHSGSMEGEKIEFVKEALKDMIELLHHEDRICLVEFDNRVNRITPLIRASPDNKKWILKLISEIEANGGTNIDLGMRKALNVIKNRKYRNPVTGIFLLSDGLDEGAELRVAMSLAEFALPDFFVIDSFGLGHEHCPKIMVEIAKLEHGAYYNIEKHDEVDECFVDAVAGLMSVVAVNVILQVEQIGAIQMQKGYGDHWEKDSMGNNVILMNNLLCGGDKDFMAEFVMKYKMNSIETPQIKVKFQATIPGTNQVISKEKTIKLPAYDEFNQYQDLEEDPEVLANMHRVKAAEAMLFCHDLKKEKNHDKALDNLQQIIDDINQCQQSNKDKMKHLIRDLNECMTILNLHEEQFEKKRHKLVEKSHAHLNQKSHGEANEDSHANSLQKKLVNAMIKKKGLID